MTESDIVEDERENHMAEDKYVTLNQIGQPPIEEPQRNRNSNLKDQDLAMMRQKSAPKLNNEPSEEQMLTLDKGVRLGVSGPILDNRNGSK